MAISDYKTFCEKQAADNLTALNTNEHQDTLKQIEKLKGDYNGVLAQETVAAGVSTLNNKFINNKDYGSALLLQMIVEMVKDNSTNFSNFCLVRTTAICQLPSDQLASVEATFLNFRQACDQLKMGCEKNSEVNKIKIDDVENFIKSQQAVGFTPEVIAGLKPLPTELPADSEARKNIREQISALQDTNTKFKDVENIKRYIGERYLRTCSATQSPTEVMSNCGAAGVPQIMDINIIDQNFKILGALSSQQGEASTFSKAEIKSYKEICDRNSSDTTFKETCNLISDDFEKTQQVKESKDWAELRKNNYIVPDHTPGGEGYKLVPKQSNTSIFLGALAPAIANFSSFWMWDITQQAQIDMMGQQAILERQYNFGYFSTYNINGYFPASYYPTSLSMSTGFNFGP
jgi:hypothetical protein